MLTRSFCEKNAEGRSRGVSGGRLGSGGVREARARALPLRRPTLARARHGTAFVEPNFQDDQQFNFTQLVLGEASQGLSSKPEGAGGPRSRLHQSETSQLKANRQILIFQHFSSSTPKFCGNRNTCFQTSPNKISQNSAD